MNRHRRLALLVTIVCGALWITSTVAFAKGPAEALAYIKARQAVSGGFAEPDAEPDGTTTSWAMLAGSSAGENVLEWKNQGEGPLEYLQTQAQSLSRLDDIELYTLALAEAGADPHDLGGKDLIALISAHVKEDGMIGDNTSQHCWGMIALQAAGEAVPPKSTGWLVEHQRADGGWGESDKVVIADTGVAVEALVAVGEEENAAIEPAMKFLRGKMGPEGGFAGASGKPDTSLTSAVVRAIYASSQDPGSEQWTWHGSNPVTFLDSMQAADGHYQFSKGVESQPTMTTSKAVPAVSGKHFPLTDTATVDVSKGGQRDGSTPSDSASEADAARSRRLSASGTANAGAGLAGIWLFLMVCGAYVLTLGGCAIIAAALYEPAPAPPPALVFHPQGPESTEGPTSPPGRQANDSTAPGGQHDS
jgi:iron complex transport system substrate-binding protein